MVRDNARRSSGLNKFYVIIGLVAVVGAVVVGSSLRRGSSGASEPVDLGNIQDRELVELAQGIIFGDPDAPVTIMEFGDYQCPACRSFALLTKPQLDLAYIETGQAKLVYHDFPLSIHPHAFVAARAARCANEQDRYSDYHDALFRTQEAWSPLQNATNHFNELAGDVGLDTEAFRECLESDRHADVVTANVLLGERLGVGGTPTIFVHHGQQSQAARRLGGFQFIDIQQAMEAGAGN